MNRNYVRRGILSLAVVTSLAFSGSRPAAARELNLMERLNRVWSAVTGTQPAWAQLAGWFGGDKPTKAASTPTSSTVDKGWGMDPNGNSILTSPTSDPSGLH